MTENAPPGCPLRHRAALRRWLALPGAILILAISTVAEAKNAAYVLPADIASSPFSCSLLNGTTYTCPGGIDLAERDKVTTASSSLTLIVTGNVDIGKKVVVGSAANPINLIASGQIKLDGDKDTAVYGNISAYTIDMGGEANVYGNCSSSVCKEKCAKLGDGGKDDHILPSLSNCTSISYRLLPSVSTEATSDISATGATLNATVSSNGLPSAASFGYSATAGSYTTSCGTLSLSGSSINSPVSCSLSGLNCNTLYYWQPYATNGVGSNNGSPASFKTSDCPIASSFDAYEDFITNADAVTPAKRVIQTRVANAGNLCKQDNETCALRITAFDTNNLVASSNAATISAQLQSCANVSRPANTSPSCGGTWSDLGATQTVTLANGIGTATFAAINNAYEIVRVKISSSTDKNSSWYSSDTFAIRPASLTVSASDDDSSKAGTTRSLTIGDSKRTSDFTHIAGKGFTLTVASGASNYAAGQSDAGTGTGPVVDLLKTTLDSSTVNGVLTTGSWSSSGGTLSSTTATYDEAGSFKVTLKDKDFAAIDTGDGSSDIDRHFSGSATLGRFTPEKFLLTDPRITPAFNSRTAFTYFGQDGFSLRYTLTPVNAAGTKTKNYVVTAPGKDLVSWAKQYLSATVLPEKTPLSNGSTLSASPSTTSFSFTWDAGSAVVFASSIVSRPSVLTNETTISLTARPKDSDGITTTDAVKIGTTKLRFGRLRLLPAYGSDLFPLRVPVRAEYYNGNGWSLNIDDSATRIPAGSLALDPIIPANSGLTFSPPPAGIVVPTSYQRVIKGSAAIVITPLTRGVGGAFIALNMGYGYAGDNIGCRTKWSKAVGGATPALSIRHLAGNTCGNSVNTLAPAALIKFGSPRAPFDYLRERY